MTIYKNGKKVCNYNSERDVIEMRPTEITPKKQLTPEEITQKNNNKPITRTEIKVYNKKLDHNQTFFKIGDFCEYTGTDKKSGIKRLFKMDAIANNFNLLKVQQIRTTVGELKQLYLNEPIRFEG